MTLYRSKKGEIGDRAYWERELNTFWSLFDSKSLIEIRHRLPNKPVNAWERFSKIIGLEEFDENSSNSGVSL